MKDVKLGRTSPLKPCIVCGFSSFNACALPTDPVDQ